MKRYWTRFAMGYAPNTPDGLRMRPGWRLTAGATVEDCAQRVAVRELRRSELVRMLGGGCHVLASPATVDGMRAAPWRDRAALMHCITMTIRKQGRQAGKGE